jgi:DNA-binding transcriptional LysR family regulator
MAKLDLNLLITLDAVLSEGSVARAARRLRLSPSAMSRALARLRRTTGDPLLVRAGRGLVPTPRALELREQVSQLVWNAKEVLRPAEKLELETLERTFTLRTSDGFVENFGPRLIARVKRDAPNVCLRFLQKIEPDNAPLREATVDLETGVVAETTAPEFRVHALFRDRFAGVVRAKHPLAKQTVTATRFAAAEHVFVDRRGVDRGMVDDALAARGLTRRIAVIVTGFSAALAIARGSDLVAVVPERHTAALREGMHTFTLPVQIEPITVSMLWHPRLDADPAHRWLRTCVREVCGKAASS